MRILSAILAVVCLLTGCSSRSQYGQQFQYEDDGRAKPKVALIPVFDHSKSTSDWSLSEEFSETIQERFFQSGKFFLTSDLQVLGKTQGSSSEISPFSGDISWLSEINSPSEFVVFVELLEHTLLAKPPTGLKITTPYVLTISFRVRVVDLREEKPKVILQELQQETFNLSWHSVSINYKKDGLGKTAFHFSPLGLAHNQMAKKITTQIQDYILIAKSHR
jgi:hypothetical protein